MEVKEVKSEIINARVTKAEREELRAIAKYYGKSISDLIRETINKYKNK